MNTVHELPARAAGPLHATMEAERKAATCDRDLAEHFLESLPAPDWESLIAAGTVPALVLGAERRLHRR